MAEHGVVTGRDPGAFATAYLEALAQYRHWDRQDKDMVPA
jgi:hypothetical protein